MADLPELTRIRVSVKENAMTEAELAAAGITHESMAEKPSTRCKGRVAESDGRRAGFSIADSEGEIDPGALRGCAP